MTFFHLDSQHATLYCEGQWHLHYLLALKQAAAQLEVSHDIKTLDGSAIENMDSAGALVLQEIIDRLKPPQQNMTLRNFSKEHLTLIKLVEALPAGWQQIPPRRAPLWLAKIGEMAVNKWRDFLEFLSFIGELATVALHVFLQPRRIPWRGILSVMETAGVKALFIIGLLSFLIGVVLTYQMGLQLRNYGANIYIVDLLGLSLLREFAPLITAIIIAGRSGSAFTAQLGTMKIREEVDALRTMGIAPAELLILPKVVALFFIVPLLTVWSSVFGVMGGMVISKTMLQVGYTDFLHRFYEAVAVKSYYVGMIKAPVFGLIIAAIGCYQGMKVTGSAVSVGTRTTISVVQAIFFIIVADAVFSVLFSWLGI